MDEIEQLQKAIAALDGQRAALGEAVVEAALAPMREKLAALQAQTAAEQRKLVTVLFADLVGFTAMSEQMDPEDVREVVNAYFRCWTAAIDEHGGELEKFIGDAVMAVFGLSTAHEDDPERAIRAALAMRPMLAALNQQLQAERGLQLAMRIGIHTGPVVVSLLDERRATDFVVVGDSVNLASRLQSAAPVGAVMISHDTYRHVRGVFDVQALAPVQVKGKREPIQVYLVDRAKPKAFRVTTRGVEGVETRMVGRDAELKQLQEAFYAAVEDGEPHFISVVGEAGIGKSRLLYEFDNWVELLPESTYYFKSRAYAAARHTAYSLLRTLFTFQFGIQESDPPTLAWEKIVQGVCKVLGETDANARKAHFIGGLLGFELAGSAWQENAMDARRFRLQALAYLADYFRTLAQKAPVIVLLEDIHWADDSSLDLIHWMEDSLAQIPLLVICTARPGLYQRRPNWGEGLLFYRRLDLRPLTKRDSRDLVAEILQRAETVPVALRELVVERAEGNPFYIEEGIKLLIEEGVIEKTGEHWRVHTDQLTTFKIPATLVGVLQARLEALPTLQQSLLQRAAVIGRVFWDHAVGYLEEADEVASPGDSGQVQEILSELRAREIIFQRERSTFDQTHEYLFKHILMRDVSYESLLKRQRRNYHARTARWLEAAIQRNQQREAYADFIAQHWEQAEQWDLAAAWYRKAGKYAAARYANSEAVHAFTKALELTSDAPTMARFELLLERERVLDRQGDRQHQADDLESLARLGALIDAPICRADAALRRANFAFNTGAYDTAATAAQEAVGHARQAGSVEKEAEGYHIWGSALDFQLTRPEALAKLEQALKLARAAGLANVEADILMSLGPHFSDLNRYEEARTHLAAALEIFQRLADRWGAGRTLSNLGVTYWGEGNFSEAKNYFEAAFQVMQEIGERRGQAIMLGNLGVIAHEQLDYTSSRHYHLQALAINREIRNQHSSCINLGNLGETERDLGNFSQAPDYYEQALLLAQELGLVQNQSAILLSYSALKEYLGDAAAALEDARQALMLARQANSIMYEAGSLHRIGQALLIFGRYEEARTSFQQATELLRNLGLENRGIESLAGLAQAYLQEGDIRAAQDQVEEILAHLQDHDLFGTDEPVRVYLSCSQVLQACGDPRFPTLLEAGYHFLQDRAAAIHDESQRQIFLEQVPWNRILMELWREK